MCNEMSLQDRYEFLAELNEKKEYTELTGAFLKLFLDTNCELPASKEAGFRRRQPKDTGFEPAGSLFSCLSG